MGIMEDISGYFNQGPPASDSYLGQVMDYGMRFGGNQFGITPQQTAAYMEDRKQNQTLDFIRKNTIPGDPNARPIGNNLAELDANIAAMQPRFNPAMEMELAARTGTMGQYLAGMQAMQRQQQAQVYDSNNMTAAQYAAHTLNTQKAQWEKDRQDLEFNSLSAAQKAQLAVSQANTGVAQGHLSLAREKQAADAKAAALANQFPALGLNPEKKMEFVQNVAKLDRAAEISTDVIDYLSKVGVGGKALDRGNVNAMQGAYQQHVVPALVQMVGTGTIQKGDLDFVQSIIGDPGSWVSLDARQKAKVAQILQTVNDQRSTMYGFAGRQAPPIRPGSSAWARSASSASAPSDTVWGQ